MCVGEHSTVSSRFWPKTFLIVLIVSRVGDVLRLVGYWSSFTFLLN
jgi:hypothetical protein